MRWAAAGRRAMGAVSGAPLAIRQNTGKTEEWFPGQGWETM